MRFVIFDLEFTQPNKKIIQIGAVTLDLQKGEIETFFDEICDPGELPNDYITNLTGITEENVKTARSLSEVPVDFWAKFKKAKVDHKIASWGSLDIDLIRKASRNHFLTIPHLKPYNIKNHVRIFNSIQGESSSKGVGLKKVSESLNLEFVGTQHNALSDAHQTARVFLDIYHKFQS